MNWIYPDVINNLKKKCNSYLNKKISLDEIQSSIYKAIEIDEHLPSLKLYISIDIEKVVSS